MSHFAEIRNGVVTRVIVAEADYVAGQKEYVQTSYNTRGGVHMLGGNPLRKNFAGIGFTYDPVRDAFIPPKPFNSWILDENTCWWNAPVVKPSAGRWQWNEILVAWEPMK